MSQRPILADVDLLLGKALDKLYSLKPNALQYVNNGGTGDAVYGNLAVGLRAQLVLMYKRLSSGIVANRIPTATGSDLVNLVTSEIGTPPALGKRFAGGTITLGRYTPHPPYAVGVIAAGTIFTRNASSTSSIPIASSSYISTADIAVGPAMTEVVIPVRATTAGAAANAVLVADIGLGVVDPNVSVISTPTLFDPLLVVSKYPDLSGGSDGVTNDDLRKWAYASHISDNGPTLGAIAAQVLIENGVAHYSILDDSYGAQLVIYVADKSWGSGPSLAMSVAAQLETGFSTATLVYHVENRLIGITATITLTDQKHLSSQADISVNVQNALRSYFDDRSDWHTFTADGVDGAIISSDPRISSTVATVTYAQYSSEYGANAAPGDVLNPPTGDPRYMSDGVTPAPRALHYYLAGNAVDLTFTA